MNKLVVVLGFSFMLVGCKVAPLEEARDLVDAGDLRDDVVVALGEKAWYHQPCQYPSSIVDLFFYNSHEYDKADIVIVTSLLEDEEYRVSNIGSFEPYVWHSTYRDCIDRTEFED